MTAGDHLRAALVRDRGRTVPDTMEMILRVESDGVNLVYGPNGFGIFSLKTEPDPAGGGEGVSPVLRLGAATVGGGGRAVSAPGEGGDRGLLAQSPAFGRSPLYESSRSANFRLSAARFASSP